MRRHVGSGAWIWIAGVLAGLGCAAPVAQAPSEPAPDAAPRGDALEIDEPEADAAPPPPPPPAVRHADLAIAGDVVWHDSGLDVVATEVLAFTSTGEITIGTGVPSIPEGLPVFAYAAGSAVWSVNHGAVIGKLGVAGAPFRIGSGVTFTAPISGRLYVGQNDLTTGDNGGAFTVSVDVGPIGTVAVLPGATSSVAVPSTTAWVDTGLDLILLEQIAILASGTINLSATVTANADGSPDPAYRPSNVMPNSNHGVLLGRIGTNGIPFPVGRSLALAAPYPGRLYLGVNDVGLTNNAGSLSTTITTASP